MKMEQFNQRLRSHHLREGVELVSTEQLADGSVAMCTRLEDGEKTNYVIPAADVARIVARMQATNPNPSELDTPS